MNQNSGDRDRMSGVIGSAAEDVTDSVTKCYLIQIIVVTHAQMASCKTNRKSVRKQLHNK